MIIIGNIVVDSLDNINHEKIKKELMKNSKEYLVEMLIESSVNLEKSSTKCESFRQENMISKRSIGGVVI